MGKNKLFDKYRKKLIVEAVLRSLMMSAIIAFSVSAVLALALWLAPVGGTWYAVGTLLFLLVALTPMFYFFKYRPNDRDIARRLDRLGLEERMITMTEFGESGNDSYIVKRQKADAESALKTKLSMPLALPLLAIIPLALTFVFSGSMITVNALAESGVIDDGNKIISGITTPDNEKFCSVVYKVVGTIDGQTLVEDEGGMIDGVDDQLVVIGGSATPVVAVADDDWVFVCWDLDESQTDPYRCDADVTVDSTNTEINEDGYIVITHTAYFVMIPDGDPDSSDGDPSDSNEDENDAPSDAPNDSNDQSEGGSSSENGSSGDPQDDDSAGGSNDTDKDMVIDGQQDYHARAEEYLQEALRIMAEGGEIPEAYKKIIKDYYGIIL